LIIHVFYENFEFFLKILKFYEIFEIVQYTYIEICDK